MIAAIGAFIAGSITIGTFLLILGAVGAGIGLKGRKVVKEVVKEVVEISPAPRANVQQTELTTIPAPFTAGEINELFDALSITNKIVRSI